MNASTRKRGRPKGSINKPKVVAEPSLGLFDDLPSFPALTGTSPIAASTQATSAAHALKIPDIFVRPAKPVPTQVFCTYWWFAYERQNVFFRKIRNPTVATWTDDDTLTRHKFTNAYRASDRVSQYLIGNIIEVDDPFLRTPHEVFFRTMLFKLFNKIETWQLLERKFGQITWADYNFEDYDRILSHAINSGARIYSAAYIMACPSFGRERKHSNHLKLLEEMMYSRLPDRIHQRMDSLEHAFNLIRSFRGIGNFLAYQYAIDLNYGPLLNANEDDFVVPGPGALDGIQKCFSDLGGYSPADVIKYACAMQNEAFSVLGLDFMDLWGRKLYLIDCQNLFCEVDKYARVHHPDTKGRSDRTRIKQIYRPLSTPIQYRYPKRWGLDEKIAADPGYEKYASSVSR
ncbi:nucleotide kinase domain-containing protein [Azospirillum brasilense]|uniref:nucleotide kinase domain-containing protein n=1 Tax=Azospirillum brasilense TaxID=192 RepID=UPI00190DA69D|nr:nucleotide kinase domain-containing protein [Azospirillum brasilense]